jgi:non-specific serine/threonine protein kinase
MLGVSGERALMVPSLSMPNPRESPSLEVLSQYEAVRLFKDRATNVMPDFALTDQNSIAIAQICRRLDGIPLALELAAARVKVLRVDQISARLSDSFHLLTGGTRTALPRQQTLQAALDWSYDLLSEVERRLFNRLSVFAGGWTLEAAEGVCAGEGIESTEILDLLVQLVNKSLVLAERAQGEETRYRFLEIIRQYALAKLVTSGEADAVRQLHAEYYLALVEATAHRSAVRWDDRYQAELDNLRRATTGFRDVRWHTQFNGIQRVTRLAGGCVSTFRGGESRLSTSTGSCTSRSGIRARAIL